MIKLRRFHSPQETALLYANIYDSTRWPEHDARVRRTVDVAREVIQREHLTSVVDLSCGDGRIIDALGRDGVSTHQSDLSGPYSIPYSIEYALTHWGHLLDLDLPEVADLFICTETIEHLEAPWTVLEKTAAHARWLLLSTPLDERPEIGNHEHYWSFTEQDVESILEQSGWHPIDRHMLAGDEWTYTYQLWVAQSKQLEPA